MMLHGILGGSELVLCNHVILVVLEVTLTVRRAQACRRVALEVSLVLLFCEPCYLWARFLAFVAEDGPDHLAVALRLYLALLHVIIRHGCLHQGS